jgi:hypothetical protein
MSEAHLSLLGLHRNKKAAPRVEGGASVTIKPTSSTALLVYHEWVGTPHRPGSVKYPVTKWEVYVRRDEPDLGAANERITKMAEDLRKAEQVRDRLEGLNVLMGSYPEGHDMRTRLEALHIESALEGVEQDIRVLMDSIQYPQGT